MSEVKVNKVSPRSGTTITLGDSGDTITIPSGVTLSNAGTNTFASATITGDLTVDTNTLKVDSTNNRVGIGTASPTSKLQVEGSTTINSTGTPPLTIHHTDGNIVALAFKNNASDNHSLMFTDGDFRINYDGSEKMRIDSSGNVGIGTSSPNFPLEIYKASTAEVAIGSSANGTAQLSFYETDIVAKEFFVKYDGANNNGVIGTSGISNAMVIARDTGFVALSGTPDSGRKLHIEGNDTSVGITLKDTAGSQYGINSDGGSLIFKSDTGNVERMRIDATGNVLIGKTSTSSAVAGVRFVGSIAAGLVEMTRNGGQPLNINRMTDDGTLVAFYQNDVTEGTISVNGTTVSYNGFTGTHWSRFTDNSTPNILKGTVLETLDEMCDWYNLEFDITTTTQDEDGNDVTNTVTEKVPHVLADGQSNGDVITYNHEGTDYQATIVKETDIKHMKSKVSDNSDAKNVYGVFVAYDLDGEGYNDFYVASVGSFVVRIKANETIAKGDLLQSNGDGTAKVQTDDAVRSSSFAKVLSTTVIETYDDGSFIVPCSLMC